MTDLHGIIYAYHAYSALGDLVMYRTSASLPFCSRYRLIDFALSSMTNAGVKDVGVIMQRGYQSLLDHLGSGKDWDLSRSSGGLYMLPPFSTRDSRSSEYAGCMEALSAVETYIRNIRQSNIVLFRGDLAVNVDLRAAYDMHMSYGADITAVCGEKAYDGGGYGVRFVPEVGGVFSRHMHFSGAENDNGIPSLEVYIIRKQLLLDLIEWSQRNARPHFHRDALSHYLRNGGRVCLYRHTGFTAHICSIEDYFGAHMDMLDPKNRRDLFPEERPVYTRGRSSVSTYYGEDSNVNNSLIADGCYIEGAVENSVIFRGVRIHKGSVLKNCIIMRDSEVGENAVLTNVICDKSTGISPGSALIASERLPIVVPKGKKV